MIQDIVIALVSTLFGALVAMATFTVRQGHQLLTLASTVQRLESEITALRTDVGALDGRISAEARRLEIQFKDEVEDSRHRLIDTAIQPLVARLENQWAIRFDDHESRIRTLEGTERRGRDRTLPEEG